MLLRAWEVGGAPWPRLLPALWNGALNASQFSAGQSRMLDDWVFSPRRRAGSHCQPILISRDDAGGGFSSRFVPVQACTRRSRYKDCTRTYCHLYDSSLVECLHVQACTHVLRLRRCAL